MTSDTPPTRTEVVCGHDDLAIADGPTVGPDRVRRTVQVDPYRSRVQGSHDVGRADLDVALSLAGVDRDDLTDGEGSVEDHLVAVDVEGHDAGRGVDLERGLDPRASRSVVGDWERTPAHGV